MSIATHGGLSSEDKFAVVVESAAFNEIEFGEYCRRKGLYPQKIAAWRESCLQANRAVSAKAERAELRAHKQQVQTLQRELRRKEKPWQKERRSWCSKKVQPLFAEHGDERLP